MHILDYIHGLGGEWVGGGNVGEVVKDPDKRWEEGRIQVCVSDWVNLSPEQSWRSLLLFHFHHGCCSNRDFSVHPTLAEAVLHLWGGGMQLTDGW